MGRYDNFHNTKNIEKAQKKLDKLLSKRKPDQYQIDLAREALAQAKLFESCQIFKSFSGYAPNENIMFSDDNRVMWFIKYLVPYDEISSYSIVENVVQKAQTQTKSRGVISRAIIGGAIAGGVGAVVGAASAGSKSQTTYYNEGEGFFLQIFTKNGERYSCHIESNGFIANKVHPKWLELGTKLQSIIDGKV
ncbi:hypothetical protein [Dysosmobacter sp.]|uniref:hypothetical protein n=1 Tax=Dysosmobacter sp. TaxID=2591382 RepID=UPI003A942333